MSHQHPEDAPGYQPPAGEAGAEAEQVAQHPQAADVAPHAGAIAVPDAPEAYSEGPARTPEATQKLWQGFQAGLRAGREAAATMPAEPAMWPGMLSPDGQGIIVAVDTGQSSHESSIIGSGHVEVQIDDFEAYTFWGERRQLLEAKRRDVAKEQAAGATVDAWYDPKYLDPAVELLATLEAEAKSLPLRPTNAEIAQFADPEGFDGWHQIELAVQEKIIIESSAERPSPRQLSMLSRRLWQARAFMARAQTEHLPRHEASSAHTPEVLGAVADAIRHLPDEAPQANASDHGSTPGTNQ
jgi:hypothetical protein